MIFEYKKECERFTWIDKNLSGLGVDLFLDDSGTDETEIFALIQNSYDTNDFYEKIVISVYKL